MPIEASDWNEAKRVYPLKEKILAFLRSNPDMAQIQGTTIGVPSQPTGIGEIGSLKSRLQKTWMAGDYDRFSRYMEDGARQYYERLEIPPGAKFLDIGCGSGQLALMASRDGFDTTGVDIAENLIEVFRCGKMRIF